MGNTFGILATKWRIFYTPIRASVENLEKCTLICLTLHDYLCLTDNVTYCLFPNVLCEIKHVNILMRSTTVLKLTIFIN